MGINFCSSAEGTQTSSWARWGDDEMPSCCRFQSGLTRTSLMVASTRTLTIVAGAGRGEARRDETSM